MSLTNKMEASSTLCWALTYLLLITAICSELYCSFMGKDSRVSEALVNLPKVSDLKSKAFS